MKTEQKITKLTNEYERKIINNCNNLKVLLIDFAREYNQIWRDDLQEMEK